MMEEANHICPVERAGLLDSKIRRWFQDPVKILSPYLQEGMKVLDAGCGPGFFSIEIAKRIGETGKVFSVDLQQGMLDIINAKIKGTPLHRRIITIKCSDETIITPEKVDFILAFYMVHEVPGKDKFFRSVKNLLKEKGSLLIVEPKFHVSKKEFDRTISIAIQAGFTLNKAPHLMLSYSAILTL